MKNGVNEKAANLHDRSGLTAFLGLFSRRQRAKWQLADIWRLPANHKKHAKRVSYDLSFLKRSKNFFFLGGVSTEPRTPLTLVI